MSLFSKPGHYMARPATPNEAATTGMLLMGTLSKGGYLAQAVKPRVLESVSFEGTDYDIPLGEWVSPNMYLEE